VKKTRKLFQVAKELNLATSTLTEELQNLGYEVTKKQMTPIEDEAYGKLLKKFAPERWAVLQSEVEQDDSVRQAAVSQQVREEQLRKIMEGDSSRRPTPSVRSLDRSEILTGLNLDEEAAGAEQATTTTVEETPSRLKRTSRGDGAKSRRAEGARAGKPDKESKGQPANAPSVRGGVSNEDILAFTPAEPAATVEAPKKEPKASRSPQDFTSTDEDEDKPRGRKRKRKAKRDTDTPKPAGPSSGGWLSTGEAATGRKRKRRDKRKKPDAAEVAATVKETLAAMDSTGKRKRKRRVQLEVGIVDEDQNLLKITEFVSTQELATLLDVPVTDLIKECLMLGLRVTINQRMEKETIQLLAEEHGFQVEFVDELEQQEMTATETEEEEGGEELVRPPVVTIMGHVDHGKTTLLDFIRKSHIVEGEAGGITQHIGAYEIEHNGNKITFLDTPGHEAFTAMRARGAQVTDVVVLVVAADDQVMPQTVEAIDHARAAGVPMVVAINKMDKPGANAEKVRQQLAEHNVQVEEWGGDIQSAEISAKKGTNLGVLLDKILIATEILELKAVQDASARGFVIESRQEKGRGTVATILIQRGTLHIGDVFVAGPHFGRVRAMFDERGGKRDAAVPGQPVQITGFEGAPHVGDQLVVFHEEHEAKEIAFKRQQQIREQEMRMRETSGRGDILLLVEGSEKKELRLVIKGDVDGSVEAIADSLMRLVTDEVEVKIIRRAVGPINESDILLASASKAMVIGFNVHPMGKAREMALRDGVPLEIYRIIYELIEDIKGIIVGMHKRQMTEEIVGTAEVRDTFKISRIGTIAGCYVTEGKIERNNRVRLLRDGTEAYNGEIETLRRHKDDAKEVAQGYECGIKIANFNDIKVGDLIQAYKMVEVDREIEVG